MAHAADTRSTEPDPPSAGAPRLVFFGVASRKELARLATAAAPGTRFASRRALDRRPGRAPAFPASRRARGRSLVLEGDARGVRGAGHGDPPAPRPPLGRARPAVLSGLPVRRGGPRAAQPRRGRIPAARPRRHRPPAEERGCSGQLSARPASVTPCGGSRAAAPARERPGRGPARRRPARRRRACLWPGAGARAGGLGQDQDAGEPRGRARGPRRGPFRDPHARLQPQGGRTARGAAGGAGHRQHAPPRLAHGRRRTGSAPRPPRLLPAGRRTTGLPGLRAPRRGPLRHVQRLRLPLSARGAAGALHARPRRPLAARPHGARHGDGRRLAAGAQAAPRQRPGRRVPERPHARARRARTAGRGGGADRIPR